MLHLPMDMLLWVPPPPQKKKRKKKKKSFVLSPIFSIQSSPSRIRVFPCEMLLLRKQKWIATAGVWAGAMIKDMDREIRQPKWGEPGGKKNVSISKCSGWEKKIISSVPLEFNMIFFLTFIDQNYIDQALLILSHWGTRTGTASLSVLISSVYLWLHVDKINFMKETTELVTNPNWASRRFSDQR